MTKRQRKKNVAQQQNIPESVDVTIDGIPLSFMEEECINPSNWVTFKEYDRRQKLSDKVVADYKPDVSLSDEEILDQIMKIHCQVMETGRKPQTYDRGMLTG